jgi:glutaconate CoA-transferase subunit B
MSPSDIRTHAAPFDSAMAALPHGAGGVRPGAPYTLAELMVTATARELQDGDVVFVGARLPLLAMVVAQKSGKQLRAIYENGLIRTTAARDVLRTMGDPPNITGALYCGDSLSVLAALQQGRVDVGILGAGEIDRFGNLNSTEVQFHGRTIRLPGSGGAADIACLAKRLIVIMKHERRRFVERVHYRTSPGHGEGAGWRERMGLPPGGPSAVVTTLGILRFDEATGEAYLAACHPGVTPEDVREHTGWDLRVAAHVETTPEPTQEELELIRAADPGGFWTQPPPRPTEVE